MILSDAAIRNRTTVFVLIFLIFVAGLSSYLALPREAAPEVKFPHVLITTVHRGVSPEDIENTITKEIEVELSGLKGLKEIRSISAEGISTIDVEFDSGVDIDDALQRVKDKVDIAAADLPTDPERQEPIVQELDSSEFPILMIGLAGDVSEVRLKQIAERLEDEIEAVPGVLEVDVIGALEREIRVEIDPDRVAAYELTGQELMGVIPAEHVTRTAGSMETDGMKFSVRLDAEFDRADEIFTIPLASRGGKMIYLSDVARVRDTFKDRETYSRLDGRSSITLVVKKRVGENIVEIAERVKVVLDEASKLVPGGVSFVLTSDQSDAIGNMVRDLENNIFSGLVLVVLVLLLFMGLRSSLIVASAIPMSMLISFAVLQAMGVTLNMVVLFSLILALGMLVDNAIVIVENVYRHRQMGYGPVKAAMMGTREVAWPVITSTATTVAAFAPMLFWPGIMGEFMRYLPMTVIVVLISSLFVAMVINPVICSVAGGSGESEKREGIFLRGYRRLLHVALEHRVVISVVAILVLVSVFVIFGRRNSGVELFPEVDPKQAVVSLRFPQGTNIDHTDAVTRRVEEVVERFRTDPNTGHTLIDHIQANVGSGGYDFFGSAGGSHVANVTMIFPDFEDRHDSNQSGRVIKAVRAALGSIPGCELKVEAMDEGPPTGDPVSVRIIGRDLATLERYSDRVQELIASTPDLVGMRSDLESARPELLFRVDRQRASSLDLNTATIAQFLQTAILGSDVADFREFNDDYDIVVRLPEDQRVDLDDLLRLRIPSMAGKPVPLSSVGRFIYTPGLGTIHRIDQKRVVTVSGDKEEGSRESNAILKDVQNRLHPLGPGRLEPGDVTDANVILVELNPDSPGERSAVARRLWERMGWFQASRIKPAFAKDRLEPADRNALVGVLNELLVAKDLFRPSDYQGLDLAPQARKLRQQIDRSIQAGPMHEMLVSLGLAESIVSDQAVARFNRLVLQAAWPESVVDRPRLVLEPGYRIEYAGEKEESDKAQAFLANAFLFAILTIVCILVTQFNTLSAPLIIMTTVILSMIGVLIGLMVFDLKFGIIMTGVGVISLAGVVVNNAIVLLDYTRQLQRRGMGLIDAAVEAGATRLRPVLLTAATTILGLIPMATGVSVDFRGLGSLAPTIGSLATLDWDGAWTAAQGFLILRSESGEWWKSMAIAVIFGLAFATMLTLLVVPSLYVMFTRFAERLGFHSIQNPEEQEQAAQKADRTTGQQPGEPPATPASTPGD
jgi:multidrug efflux pump subunit AcrB